MQPPPPFRLGVIIFLVVACAARPGSIRAQAPTGSRADLTVRDAVRFALDRHPLLRAARQERRAAAASVREARSGWLPVAGAEVQYRRLSENVDYTVDFPSLPGGPGEPVTFAPAILNRYGVRASIAQPLFTGLRIRSEVDAAQAEAGAAEARVRSTETDVVFRTRRAYWRLYEAEVQQDAATFALREIERRLHDIENREAAGLATETDVLRIRSRRDRLRVAAIRAQTDVDSARRALNDAMGRPLERTVQLADSVRTAPTVPDPERALDRADRRRGDLRALRETILARQAGIRAARAAWFPSVSLSGSYLYARPNDQLFPPEDRFQGTWEAGVSLSWQLSGRTRPGIERARARASASRHRLEDRQRAVRLQIRTLLQEVEQARRATEAAATSLESATAAYRSARTRYDAGMSIVSDLLDAERALRAARADLASTQSDYAITRAALDRAMGRGLPESTDR